MVNQVRVERGKAAGPLYNLRSVGKCFDRRIPDP